MKDISSTLSMKQLFYIAFLCLIMLTSACSTTLNLPEIEINMERLYLIKYTTWGHHSLAFYNEGVLTEFTYGDWQLFALNKRDSWTAWKNMTFFTQGALGRKQTAWDSRESFCDKFSGCETVVPFLAPANKAEALHKKLQQAYNSNIHTEVYNPDEQVYFVKYDVTYWGFHNCNHELVDWLEFMGADVSGKVFYKPDFIGGMKPKHPLIQ